MTLDQIKEYIKSNLSIEVVNYADYDQCSSIEVVLRLEGEVISQGSVTIREASNG